MSTVLPTNPYLAPHLMSRRISPTRSRGFLSTLDKQCTDDRIETPPNALMSTRKRKADDDGNDGDTLMTRSPSASPSIQPGVLPRTTKRVRTNAAGRPLELSRLLETLSPNELRSLLKTVVDRHPQLNAEVSNIAPRPSAEAVLNVLQEYKARMRNSFPFGNRATSDYAFNRVRQPLIELLDALKDFTQNFLPPRETQTTVSLNFLDSVTELIHRLPEWDSYQNNRHKQEAYEEIAVAWGNVIREAAKRAGGFQLRVGQWDDKLRRHHERSGERLGEAMDALSGSLRWMADETTHQPVVQNQSQQGPSIREQLFSGTYGVGVGRRMGPWE
jgi:protein Cut8